MIFIVIPAYNEEQSIGIVINEIKKCGYNNIIVVDDGSSDATGEIAKKGGAIILRHFLNRDQGAALKTGTEYALRNGADIIVHFDADGQFSASDIARIAEPILQDNSDVVLGSRFLEKKSNIPFIRKLILRAGKIFNRVFLKIKSTDPQCGFRALNKMVAEKIDIKQDDKTHCSEILEQLYKGKFRIKEIPIVVKYTEYSKSRGQSSLNALGIACKIIFSKIIKK